MTWTDPSRPVAERVEALLAAMSLDEKVAQLGSVWPKGPRHTLGGDRIDYEMAPGLEADLMSRATLDERAALGLGHMARGYGGWPQTAADGCANTRAWQRRVRDASPHGVPALVHEEGQTGFLTWGATVYPASLAWGATFDPALAEEAATAIGDDLQRAGIDQVLSPVIDVITDYRWGRCEECFGEDTYLVSTMGAAFVRGVQAHGVIATLKHFAGHAASRSGRNHASASIGRRELEDVHLPPFEACVREGGARSVMNSYAAVDGVLPAASVWLLTDVLRGRWGFDGTVVADYNAVANLLVDNHIAEDLDEAAVLALAAGLDVELPDTSCFLGLAGLVRAGRLDEALVDRAVRRVLTHKVERGLLDAGFDPDVLGEVTLDLDSPRNRDLARRLAEESIVLLANSGGLPVAPGARVAVVGPTADFARAHLGCYAFPNHALPGFAGDGDRVGLAVSTVREALAELLDVRHALGVPFESLRPERPLSLRPHEVADPGPSGIADAAALAADADVAVVCVGDLAGMFGGGTSGEGCDVESLALPGRQGDLLEAVLATGTPVVLVVVSGRPYALGAYAGRCAAVVQAFLPGCEGGPALARVLTGAVNPSGRLPVQVPRTPHQTTTYLGGPLERAHHVSTVDPTPLYPFGHGLAYTTFAVSGLELSAAEVPTDGVVTARVAVANTGDRAGTTVVQLYLSDVAASVQQPVRRLVGFGRVPLAAGEQRAVTFGLHTDQLSFTGVDLRRVVEPGRMVLAAGLSEGDLPLTASFTLTGPARIVGEGRVLTTSVALDPSETNRPDHINQPGARRGLHA